MFGVAISVPSAAAADGLNSMLANKTPALAPAKELKKEPPMPRLPRDWAAAGAPAAILLVPAVLVPVVLVPVVLVPVVLARVALGENWASGWRLAVVVVLLVLLDVLLVLLVLFAVLLLVVLDVLLLVVELVLLVLLFVVLLLVVVTARLELAAGRDTRAGLLLGRLAPRRASNLTEVISLTKPLTTLASGLAWTLAEEIIKAEVRAVAIRVCFNMGMT